MEGVAALPSRPFEPAGGEHADSPYAAPRLKLLRVSALRIERDGPLLRINLARPERLNAFDAALIRELTEAFTDVGDARAVLLAGDGESFCAGADVDWQRSAIDLSYEENVEDALRLYRMLEKIDACPAPVVARVQGYALGGGPGRRLWLLRGQARDRPGRDLTVRLPKNRHRRGQTFFPDGRALRRRDRASDRARPGTRPRPRRGDRARRRRAAERRAGGHAGGETADPRAAGRRGGGAARRQAAHEPGRARGPARVPRQAPRRMEIRKLLVANRGEIAVRIFRACAAEGIATVAAVAPDDKGALHAREADEAVEIASYLYSEEHIRAAKQTGADAIHPGYGFLAENADFAEAVEAAGLVFVGPTPDALRRGGDKLEAKRAAAAAGIPVLPTGEPDEIGRASCREKCRS